MTSKLGGRTVRTLLTNLEVLSGDGQDVLMFSRNEDGTAVIRTRKVYEDQWSSNGLRFETAKEDAVVIGSLLRGEDQSYNSYRLDQIERNNFKGPEPEDVVEARLREKIGDCSELDIERAKAANIREQKAVVELEMKRDHALDKHVGYRIDGCPSCDNEIYPGHGDGSLRPAQPEKPQENVAIDYAARRVGTAHVETPIEGRSFCGLCGYVDEVRPEIDRFYHGDSTPETPDEIPF